MPVAAISTLEDGKNHLIHSFVLPRTNSGRASLLCTTGSQISELYLISRTRPGFFAHQACSASGFGTDNALRKVIEELAKIGIPPAIEGHTDSG